MKPSHKNVVEKSTSIYLGVHAGLAICVFLIFFVYLTWTYAPNAAAVLSYIGIPTHFIQLSPNNEAPQEILHRIHLCAISLLVFSIPLMIVGRIFHLIFCKEKSNQ